MRDESDNPTTQMSGQDDTFQPEVRVNVDYITYMFRNVSCGTILQTVESAAYEDAELVRCLLAPT